MANLTGRVVAKNLKTVIVLVSRQKLHPLYQKSFQRSKRYQVDDELGVNLGEIVEIKKVRPISKNKHFQVSKVLGKDIVAVVTEILKNDAAQAIAEVMPEEKVEETPVLSPEPERIKKVEKKKRKEKSDGST